MARVRALEISQTPEIFTALFPTAPLIACQSTDDQAGIRQHPTWLAGLATPRACSRRSLRWLRRVGPPSPGGVAALGGCRIRDTSACTPRPLLLSPPCLFKLAPRLLIARPQFSVPALDAFENLSTSTTFSKHLVDGVFPFIAFTQLVATESRCHSVQQVANHHRRSTRRLPDQQRPGRDPDPHPPP